MMGVGGATRGERKEVNRSELTSSAHNPPMYSAADPISRSRDCFSAAARGDVLLGVVVESSKGDGNKLEDVGGGSA